MPEKNYELTDYSYNGLKGRKLFVPAKKPSEKTFLLIYGQHVSIERLLPMATFLSNYGDVYLVDNPGFGNMEPSYKIGQKPTLDFYDGHLKQVFDEVLPANRQIIVVGISYGFQLITHFLQNNPIYQQRVSTIVSFVGFTHFKDIHVPLETVWFLKYLFAGLGRSLPGHLFYKYFLFSPFVMTPLHFVLSPLVKKLRGTSFKAKWHHAQEQAWLWRYNDPRTHAYTGWQFLTCTDLTTKRVDLSCYHVYVEHDQYIDNQAVIKNLQMIYSKVEAHTLDLPGHSPIDIEEEYKIAELVPSELQEFLES